MKKIFIVLAFIPFTIISQVKASDAAFFNLDEKLIETTLYDLTQVENFLLEHEGITYNELILNNNFTYSLQDSINVEPPFGIPSFVWGLAGGCASAGSCVIGLGSIAFVYAMTDENKGEAKKAAYGCITGTSMWVLFYGVYFAIVMSIPY